MYRAELCEIDITITKVYMSVLPTSGQEDGRLYSLSTRIFIYGFMQSLTALRYE